LGGWSSRTLGKKGLRSLRGRNYWGSVLEGKLTSGSAWVIGVEGFCGPCSLLRTRRLKRKQQQRKQRGQNSGRQSDKGESQKQPETSSQDGRVPIRKGVQQKGRKTIKKEILGENHPQAEVISRGKSNRRPRRCQRAFSSPALGKKEGTNSHWDF